jgi:hypothetical protein
VVAAGEDGGHGHLREDRRASVLRVLE